MVYNIHSNSISCRQSKWQCLFQCSEAKNSCLISYTQQVLTPITKRSSLKSDIHIITVIQNAGVQSTGARVTVPDGSWTNFFHIKSKFWYPHICIARSIVVNCWWLFQDKILFYNAHIIQESAIKRHVR